MSGPCDDGENQYFSSSLSPILQDMPITKAPIKKTTRKQTQQGTTSSSAANQRKSQRVQVTSKQDEKMLQQQMTTELVRVPQPNIHQAQSLPYEVVNGTLQTTEEKAYLGTVRNHYQYTHCSVVETGTFSNIFYPETNQNANKWFECISRPRHTIQNQLAIRPLLENDIFQPTAKFVVSAKLSERGIQTYFSHRILVCNFSFAWSNQGGTEYCIAFACWAWV